MALTRYPVTYGIYDVDVRLAVTGELSRDALEDLTIDVNEAIREHACGDEFGAAVACEYDPPAIIVKLSIAAVDGQLVNKRVTMVLEAIEKHVDVPMVLFGQTIQPEQQD